MWIRTVNVNFIHNAELEAKGIDLNDKDAIINYFFEKGAEEEFHAFGESAEIVDKTDNPSFSS